MIGLKLRQMVVFKLCVQCLYEWSISGSILEIVKYNKNVFRLNLQQKCLET